MNCRITMCTDSQTSLTFILLVYEGTYLPQLQVISLVVVTSPRSIDDTGYQPGNPRSAYF